MIRIDCREGNVLPLSSYWVQSRRQTELTACEEQYASSVVIQVERHPATLHSTLP